MAAVLVWVALFLTVCQAQPILLARNALGGLHFTGAVLGTNVENDRTEDKQYHQRYARGVIVYSPTWGAKWIGSSPAMRDTWVMNQARLGPPVENAKTYDRFNTLSSSCVSRKQLKGIVSYCERGAIVQVSEPNITTVIVDDVYYLKWHSMRDVFGELGPPRASPRTEAGTFQFSCGNVVLAPPSDSITSPTLATSCAVVDPFRTVWLVNRILGNNLGAPISDAEPVFRLRTSSDPPVLISIGDGPDVVLLGYVQTFVKGAIYKTAGSKFYTLYGAIWQEYEGKYGGARGRLGFPTSDVITVRRLLSPTIYYANFEKGVLVLYSTGVRLFTELQVYVEKLDTRGSDCLFCGSQDLYVRASITTTSGGPSAPANLSQRFPSSGDYGSEETLSRVLFTTPIRSGRLDLRVQLEGWDSDSTSGDDRLGTFDRTFSISNRWGLDAGLSDAWTGDFKAQVQIRTRPFVDPAKQWRQNFFWPFSNFKTATLSYDKYAETFTDVDYDESWVWHPFNKLYYELAYKKIAASGNCFGMSLTSVRSQLDMSPYGTPMDQHSDQSTTRAYINRFHGYQLGAPCVFYAVDEYLNHAKSLVGLLNHAKYAAEKTRDLLSAGQYPVIALAKSQLGFDGGHVVRPYELDFTNPTNWIIRIADPNVPFAVSPDKNAIENTITVNPRTGSWQLGTGARYSSARGGWFYPIPFSVIGPQPSTPLSEAALLLLGAGMIMIAGDADVTQITDPAGKPLYKGSGQRIPTTWNDLNFTGSPSVVRVPIMPSEYLDLSEGMGEQGEEMGEVGAWRRRKLLQAPAPPRGLKDMYFLQSPGFSRTARGGSSQASIKVKGQLGRSYKVALRTGKGTVEIDAPPTFGFGPAGFDTISIDNFNTVGQSFGMVVGANKTVAMAFHFHDHDNKVKPIKSFVVTGLKLTAGVKVSAKLQNGGKNLILTSADGKKPVYTTTVKTVGPPPVPVVF